MILLILLKILKILGIILCSIIGLVLLIILMVLFVPIRYKAKGYRTGEQEDDPINVRANISWLLHLINVGVIYPEKRIVCVRVFGIPVYKYPSEKEKKEDKIDNKDKSNIKSRKNNTSKTEQKNTQSSDNIIELETKEDNNWENKEDKIKEKEDKELDAETFDSENSSKKSIFSRAFDFFNKIKHTIVSFCGKIKSLIEDKKNRVSRIKNNIHYYHTILTSDLFERTYEKTKKKVIRLLKSILPRKFKANIEVGFDDPYTTGEVIALTSIFYPVLWKNVNVIGNFEESIIRGAFKLSGRLYGFSFLKLVIYYFTDRDLKRLIRLLKKEEKSRGRK